MLGLRDCTVNKINLLSIPAWYEYETGEPIMGPAIPFVVPQDAVQRVEANHRRVNIYILRPVLPTSSYWQILLVDGWRLGKEADTQRIR